MKRSTKSTAMSVLVVPDLNLKLVLDKPQLKEYNRATLRKFQL